MNCDERVVCGFCKLVGSWWSVCLCEKRRSVVIHMSSSPTAVMSGQS